LGKACICISQCVTWQDQVLHRACICIPQCVTWQDQVLHRACCRGFSNTRQGSVIQDVIRIPPANLPAQSSIRSPRRAGTKMAAKDSSSDAHRSSCCTPSCLEPCTCISSADRTFGMPRYSSCCAHSPFQFRSFRSKIKVKTSHPRCGSLAISCSKGTRV